MSNENTESMTKLFLRLEEIRNQVQRSNQIDLDSILPIFEETEEISNKLTEKLNNVIKAIEEKRQKRE